MISCLVENVAETIVFVILLGALYGLGLLTGWVAAKKLE